MNGGFALPRLRVRSRRRKPRGPEWKRKAAWCAFTLTWFALNLAAGMLLSAAGWALAFSIEWRELHHWPCDPEARRLTPIERLRHAGLSIVAVVMMIAGVFA